MSFYKYHEVPSCNSHQVTDTSHTVQPHHFVSYSDDAMKYEHCREALLSHTNQSNPAAVRLPAVGGHDCSGLEDSGGKGVTIC